MVQPPGCAARVAMVWLGHIESEHAPAPSMGFVLEQARPNKMRQLIAAKAHSVRVFDGTHGCKVRRTMWTDTRLID